jgi:hypothetical protein
MVTVGVVDWDTVTVALAEAVPPEPVAVAVYVVVAVGLTTCVPPVDERVYELPSEPLTVTCVAFVACTVRVEDPPGAIDVGFEDMLVVGAAGVLELTVRLIVV